MTRENASSHVEIDHDGSETERYASLTLEGGSVLVYDVRCNDRWVQSDLAVTRESMR